MTSSQGAPPTQHDAVITEIISTISQAEGVDSLELTPPMNEVIDASALARFVESATRPASVRFRYQERTVEVRVGDGVEVVLLPDDG